MAWFGGFARNLKAIALAPFARGQRLRSLASTENAGDLMPGTIGSSKAI